MTICLIMQGSGMQGDAKVARESLYRSRPAMPSSSSLTTRAQKNLANACC